MKERIAVIGGGVAGIVSAYLLSEKYHVTLLEKNDYLGGHTHTIMVKEGAEEVPVDTGFIVFNDRTYPNFIKFIGRLGVEAQVSDMSFSYFDESTDFQYAGTDLNGLFAKRSNLVDTSFYKMLLEINRFADGAIKDLEAGALDGISLGDYVGQNGYTEMFITKYLEPMGAAIWSTPAGKILDFPARNFVVFFKNHGLLKFTDSPIWKTIKGGSHSYVKAFLKAFEGEVRLSTPITKITRHPDHVVLHFPSGEEEVYDHVVVATHGDQALALLADPSEEEERLLGTWRYSKNETLLHTDAAVMPTLKRAWASWNYNKEKESDEHTPVSLTYHMNRLQNLQTDQAYFVTLNRIKTIPDVHVIGRYMYEHPIYTEASVASQSQLPSLNGKQRTYFCGSYFNYGFHEDAVASAVAVAEKLGVTFG